MITLTIDSRTVAVPAGSTILFAARAAGADVPTLCHDDNLHPYGACRICMVEILGPQRRLVASCATPAANGMAVSTRSPQVIEARRAVIELLLLNHPLDCPVCDKAGDCRLQDLAHEYAPHRGRAAEEKRTLPVDRASAVIERNTDRCILCGKCVRTCRERIAEGGIAITRRGAASRVAAACDGTLGCEFCGECVESCPVGALATRQFKHRARVWNLESAGSVCPYCGSGCLVTFETDRGQVVRARSRAGYLCAKGRFGWDSVSHPDRLALPKVRRNGELVDCSWDEAIAEAAAALAAIRSARGAKSIGGLGSVRTANEDNYAFQKFLRAVVGTNNVDFLGRAKMPAGLNTAFFAAEAAAIGQCDVILMLDKDAGEINPRTGIEVVRAVNRSGSRLILVNDGRNKFNRLASVVLKQASPEAALEQLLAALRSPTGSHGETDVALAHMCSGDRLAIIVPSDLSPQGLTLLRELGRSFPGTMFIPVVRRGNLQGALDMGVLPGYFPGYRAVDATAAEALGRSWHAVVPREPGMDAVRMLESIGQDGIAALHIMGDDPVGSHPELAQVLGNLEFLMVQDLFLTETAKLAHVVLPAAGFSERSGTVTNLERRLQQLQPAVRPFGEARPDWQIIAMLAGAMGSPWKYASADDILREIRALVPLYDGLAAGACWAPDRSLLANSTVDLSLVAGAAFTAERITSGRLLFSSGGMIARSKEIASIARS